MCNANEDRAGAYLVNMYVHVEVRAQKNTHTHGKRDIN